MPMNLTTSLYRSPRGPGWVGEVHDSESPHRPVYSILLGSRDLVRAALIAYCRDRLGLKPGEPLPIGLVPAPGEDGVAYPALSVRRRLCAETFGRCATFGRRRSKLAPGG